MATFVSSGISVDNTRYHVKVVFRSLNRSFNVMEGNNSGISLAARTIRDILGTAYSYTMEIEPDYNHLADYDSFYEAISSPADYHSIKMPYGQSEMTFDAQIISGEDTYLGYMSGRDIWGGLKVTFIPMEPQRTS